LDVIETREPGGTPGADAIRALLMELGRPLTALAEAYLFAAARADHVERLIRPALEGGAWVVCDRFLDSSLAYQGGAGGLGIEEVRALNRRALGDLAPDITLLLRTDGETGRARMQARDGAAADRFGARDAAYHQAVAEAFDALADAEPYRIVPVDANGSIEAVASRIAATVEERLL
ncbi:MAG: dTMP kinase, partial [Parasphingopyxis sp.]